ncbi:MAG: MoaF N-terminal domain-containing protein [Cyclobacteriaceae bacterium]
MKRLLVTIFLIVLSSEFCLAQESEPEHLLDGTSMKYYYQNGSAVKVDFIEGMFHFNWLAGPIKGRMGSAKYQSRKISEKMYLVNFTVEDNGTFVTLLFNFNQNVMYSSVLNQPGTEYEKVGFNGGIIEHLKLVEK